MPSRVVLLFLDQWLLWRCLIRSILLSSATVLIRLSMDCVHYFNHFFASQLTVTDLFCGFQAQEHLTEITSLKKSFDASEKIVAELREQEQTLGLSASDFDQLDEASCVFEFVYRKYFGSVLVIVKNT